jgi:hypothetical protein
VRDYAYLVKVLEKKNIEVLFTYIIFKHWGIVKNIEAGFAEIESDIIGEIIRMTTLNRFYKYF